MQRNLLKALKAHCHVDHNDDDKELEGYFDSAVAYLKDAGVTADISRNATYRLAVFGLVQEWYDGAAVNSASVGLRKIINQLKMTAVADAGNGL